MRVTAEALDQALGILLWGVTKSGHRTKKMPWPPQGAQKSVQEVRVVIGDRVNVEIKTKVTPTEQHPSRVKWNQVATIPFHEIKFTESGHLRLGPFTL